MQHSGTVRIVSVLGIALLLNSMGAVVLAADIDASNNQTGYNSRSSNEISESNNSDASVTNSSNVKNNVKLNLTTGGNTVEKNTGAGGLITGDINVGLKVANESNSNTGTINANNNSAVSDVSLANSNTGSDSRSSNEVTINRNSSFRLTNTADITNKFDIALDTGNNDISKNTNAGNLRTGDIKVLLDLTNKANAKETEKDKDKDDCTTDCNKKEAPTPTPNNTPAPELGIGGAETPEVGIVPAGANIWVFILMGLTFLLFAVRSTQLKK